MGIDLFSSRQEFNIRCFWQIFDKNNENIEKKINSKKHLFYARVETSFRQDVDTVGSGFLVSNKFLSISSCDKLFQLIDLYNKGIECEVYIPSFEKRYCVENIQSNVYKQNLEFSKLSYASNKTYLELREIENEE